jgi:hypothetical protein
MAEEWTSDFPGAFEGADGSSAAFVGDDGGVGAAAAAASAAAAAAAAAGAGAGAGGHDVGQGSAAIVRHVVRVSNLPLGVRAFMVRNFFASCGVLEGGVVVLHNSASEALLALESAEDRERALRKNFEKMGRR